MVMMESLVILTYEKAFLSWIVLGSYERMYPTPRGDGFSHILH